MKLRRIAETDIKSVSELERLSFTDSWSEEMLLSELKKDYSYYVLAENVGIPDNKENNIVGYAGIWCIYETAELIRIAVSDKYKRNSYATELMRDIMDYAREQGCERMTLEVRRSNEAALGLYKKHGFKEIHVRRSYYDGEDGIVMERLLK